LAYKLHPITHKDVENHFLKGHVEYRPLCPLGNFGSNSSQAPRKPLQKKNMSMQAIVHISLAIWEFWIAQISHWHLTKHKGLYPTSSIRNNTLGPSLTSHLNLHHLTYSSWSWAMKSVIASVGASKSSPSFLFFQNSCFKSFDTFNKF
jgi:hypothetical protein